MASNPVVFAGSFDPVTNGHVDIALRARAAFGSVLVLLTDNGNKRPLLSKETRLALLQETFRQEPNIRVDYCEERLLTDYLKKHHLRVLVRGIRGAADVEHEMLNAHYNKLFYPEVETVFLPCRAECAFLSSSAVREAFSYGADLSPLVPPCVAKELKRIS